MKIGGRIFQMERRQGHPDAERAWLCSRNRKIKTLLKRKEPDYLEY